MPRSLVFRDGHPAGEDVPPERVPDLVGPGVVVWVACDPESPTELDAAAAITGIPRDGVNTVLAPHRRSRMWNFDGRFAIHTHVIQPDGEPVRLVLLISVDALVTCCDSTDINIGAVLSNTLDHEALAHTGTVELLHNLLDWLVAGYQHTTREIDERIDELSEPLFDDSLAAATRLQHDIYMLQRRLMLLRRSALPLREDIVELRHLAQWPHVNERLSVRQLDHLLDTVDSLRETLVSMLSTHINLQQSRLNQTMKKLTGWAGVIAIPTFITSWYGMNVPMPGQSHLWGSLLASAMVLAAAVAMYLMFQRKDWL